MEETMDCNKIKPLLPHPPLAEDGNRRPQPTQTMSTELDGQSPPSQFPELPAGLSAEIFQGLLRVLQAQQQAASVPQTPDSLASWLGVEGPIFQSLCLWFKSQLPPLDDTFLANIVALAFELAAQVPEPPNQAFACLGKLQEQRPQATCRRCSPQRSFILSSSMVLHTTIHHTDFAPFPVTLSIDCLVASVAQTLNLLSTPSQPSPIPSPMKRGRTRITPEQLEVLKANFDISSSPPEDKIANICAQTGLAERVVKHWFRNTLFKERQRSKECPYNFALPPTTSLTLDDYERAGRSEEQSNSSGKSMNSLQPIRRMRTAISQHQQAILLHYFKEEQNPTRAKMDLISEKVGLAKRVVQVWFQNARSRERKYGTNIAAPTRPRSEFSSPPSAFPSPLPQLASTSINITPPPPAQPITPSASEDLTAPGGPLNSLAIQQLVCQFVASRIPPLGIPQTTPSEAPLDLSTVRANDHGSSFSESSTQPRSENCTPEGSLPPVVSGEPRPSGMARRNRTTITTAQVRFMQSIFAHHKTPAISECDEIGQAIGLTRRVVQVWFQNQRAKEKKMVRVSTRGGVAGSSESATELQHPQHVIGNQCNLCNVTIFGDEATLGGNELAINEHIFSEGHMLRLLRETTRTDRWAGAPEEKGPSLLMHQ